LSGKMTLENRTVVVTGAAGGIGRGIAAALARRGCHLALADINEAGLNETSEIVSRAAKAGPGTLRVTCHQLDVADAGAVANFPDIVLAHHPGVAVLVNNAGVALGGTFEQVSAADYEWLLSINFYGVVRMTRAFLPLLRASDEARIVNLSSIFGMVAAPGQTAYAASKFAVRGFSESLRHELEMEGATVGVTVVHPGGVKTGIAQNARLPAGALAELVEKELAAIEKFLRMPPEVAGEIIVKAVEQRKARVLVGSDARLMELITRLAPVKYWKIMAKLF
jgi:NAD(P)-dependent dehydrogenase (short-subunit alcohol dehydrogenase family)